MNEAAPNGRRKPAALWAFIAVMFILCLAGLCLWGAIFISDFGTFRHLLLYEHFTVMVGLPSAAVGAFAIVCLFRQAESPIKIKALGFELEGAAGPVVLWVLCFLAISASIKLLW